MWEERYFYFVMKTEFHALDTQGHAAALSTVQIDVENADRFGIRYVASDGAKKTPLLLHASVSGAIERCLYALLESEAFKIAKGEKGEWPFWLAPTQIRFIPVSDDFNSGAGANAEDIEKRTGVRADVDDREEGVGRKIRDAEREWVPLIIVYGEREAKGGKFSVRMHHGGQMEMTMDDLVQGVEKLQGDCPRKPLPLPRRLSSRPIFRG